MIREERDPAFWVRVASHPACAGAIDGGSPHDIANIANRPHVTPLATDHGGYLFAQLDGLGTTYEIHAVFTPEGWGREANLALKEALRAFDWNLLVTYQTTNPHSRPARSFGFRPIGERQTVLGPVTVWSLTRPAWEASPAFRSHTCRH